MPLGDLLQFFFLANVTFGYQPDRPVLHSINLWCSAGQSMALVGQTGSGKTTIVNLLARFYLPTSGVVRIDGFDTRQIVGQ